MSLVAGESTLQIMLCCEPSRVEQPSRRLREIDSETTMNIVQSHDQHQQQQRIQRDDRSPQEQSTTTAASSRPLSTNTQQQTSSSSSSSLSSMPSQIDSRLVPQRLRLDGANAPLLSGGVNVPFARNNERKRGFTSAIYYSECYLNNIAPVEADSAALHAQQQYDKWWIQTGYNKSIKDNTDEGSNKRLKINELATEAQIPNERKDAQQRLPYSSNDSVNMLTEDDTTTINTNRSKHQHHRHDRNSRLDTASAIQEVSMSARYTAHEISLCKTAIIETLQKTKGDTSTTEFLHPLQILSTSYATRGYDARWQSSSTTSNNNNNNEIDGIWLTLSKPNFRECQGDDNGDCLYTLGRLAFDMFRPTNLRCSIQGVFNSIGLQHNSTGHSLPPLVCPTKLQAELHAAQSTRPVVRHYDIVTALTIVSDQDLYGNTLSKEETKDRTDIVKRPIRALLTNSGYCVPDPNVANRLTVWFIGGTLEVQDEDNDLYEWKQIFHPNSIPHRSITEHARLLAAKVLLGAQIQDGMSVEGTMLYNLKRPIGGHGHVFIDILYADDTLRIVQGHNGTIFVFTRVPVTHVHRS